MKFWFTFILCFVFVADLKISAQNYYSDGIDTVYSHKWGSGQNFGQQPEYFPANVYGLPDPSAREDEPATSPYQICSIGLNGEIIIGFRNAVLLDLEGDDFTIFENSFRYAGGKIFAEPAVISVSKDGIAFVPFPFDSLTLKGCAGITPTSGNQNPFDPEVSGGNSFDLSDIHIDSVRYIKIKDISHIILDNPNHPFYDPTVSGFDLDAVIGLHLCRFWDSNSIIQSHSVNYQVVTSSSSPIIEVQSQQKISTYYEADASIYSLEGGLIEKKSFVNDFCSFNSSKFVNGAYFIVVQFNNHTYFDKILLVH